MKNAKAAISPYFPFTRKSSIPFYRQIYEGYRAAILQGQFSPGQRLPSTRTLATELRISRLPAVNAYEQLLHEGYIEGRIGAGTYVKDTIPDELSMPVNDRDRISRSQKRVLASSNPIGTNIWNHQAGLYPFRVSLPALDHFPHKIWSRLVSRHAKHLSIENMAYGDPAGHFPLREAIAEYLRTARAVRCEASQIIIVSGSQLALQICARALLKPSDTVCMEEPGYPGARDALCASGAKLAPILVDDEGINIHEIQLRQKDVRAIYVTPSHQYPLGTSMTASRRIELLEWAQRNRSWIIEDDYDSEYRYTSRPFGSLQGMDDSASVIYIGTFSKVLFPSVRVGYMVVPPEIMNKFVQLRESLDIFSPTLYQLVLTDFIQEGHFARHLRRMRAIYFARRNALVESLRKNFGKTLIPYNAEAGLHLTALLPSGFDDREIVRRAAERGINPTALSTCYAGKKPKTGLILGFGGANESQLQDAVKILRSIFKDYRKDSKM